MTWNVGVSALAAAVKSHLQTELSLDDSTCDLRPSGRPPATAGELFYAVHSPRAEIDSFHQDCLSERLGFSVSITMRGPVYPTDTQGTELTFPDTGLMDLARQVVELLHENYVVMGAANGLLPAGADPIIEPAYFSNGDSEPQPVGPEWFYSEASDPSQNIPAGYTVQLVFGNAHRLQSKGNFVL